MEQDEPFHRRLERLLSERGLTISDLARGVGTDYATAWCWVRGGKRRHQPTAGSLARIARYLGIPIVRLVDGRSVESFEKIIGVIRELDSYYKEIRLVGDTVILSGRAKVLFEQIIEEVRRRTSNDQREGVQGEGAPGKTDLPDD
ncbi:MAG: helix-turn-helix domain-containing protein [Planctomycetota bacterium]